MSVRSFVALAILASLAACGPAQQSEAPEASASPDYAAKAMQIAKNSIIVDTHIDVPYRIYSNWADVSEATDGGDTIGARINL